MFPDGNETRRARPVGTDLVREVVGRVKIPFFAIGGITLDNIDQVLEAGRDARGGRFGDAESDRRDGSSRGVQETTGECEMSVLITGSVALDSVKTPVEEHHDLLGGSASYASVAASFFTPVNMVAIVGTDFPKKYIELYRDARDQSRRLAGGRRQDVSVERRIRVGPQQAADACRSA